MERQITVTSKEFDKAVGDISHAIIQSGESSTDKVIAAMLFSFAVFDQLYAEHGTKAADVAEWNDAVSLVGSMPSAQPEEVTPHRNYKYLSDYWCECGWHLGKKGEVKYCAECGMKVNWHG